MSKKIDIGASISCRTDASQNVDNVFAAEDFPCCLNIQNHTVTRLILPELKALDIPALSSVEAEFSDLGLLKRVVSSLAQISRLNNYQAMATIYAFGADLSGNEQQIQDPVEEVIAPQADAPALAAESSNDGETYATLIEELENGSLLVEVDGVQFEVKKNQLRENGSLTAGGITAYQTAKNISNE